METTRGRWWPLAYFTVEHFEKAGVGFSHVKGAELPPSATALRPSLLAALGKLWALV